jgi:hypothetical protein
LVLLAPCALACAPEFSDRSSFVSAPRVLAVRSLPAEALAGTEVSYQILVVDEQGGVSTLRANWSYCTQPKPTNELNDVATACFGTGDIVSPFGAGFAPKGKLPVNACAQFGPNVPQRTSGGMGSDTSGNAVNQTQGRPTDPDSTGGYYQPLIVEVSAKGTRIPTLGETRITCGLAGSTGEQFEDFNKRTKPNTNPQLSLVTLDSAELTLDSASQPLSVAAAKKVTLHAGWPVCPATPSCGDDLCSPGEAVQDCPEDCTTPKGCGGSEPFAYLDPEKHALVSRHESMRVSWFATAGTFGNDHTGRAEADFALPSSDNTWAPPKEPGPVFIWVVLRDDRGGVDWQSFKVVVQ